VSVAVRVVPLAERPDLVETVAAWGFGTWGHLSPGYTLSQRRADLLTEMRPDGVPTTFVAVDQSGAAVGTAALIFDDIEGDPRNPWLASVYVPPEARRHGIASLLVRRVEHEAARLGYRRLYLFTATVPQLYAGLGWCPLEQRNYRGELIQVMDRSLQRPGR
jgi:N-acetylglutamate synthase-like GNAT family acetyltransferase